MATTLKNIIRFTGLVVGVPTLLPHRLNLDDLAVVPEVVTPNQGPFIVAVNATNVTVTRIATSPADAVDVYVEFIYSPERVFDPVNDPPAGLPFILQPGGGGGGSAGSSNSLIYQPGSAFVGPTIFGLWADLITRLTALRVASNGGGTYEIGIDDSTISPAVIPAGAYDMAGVTMVGAAPANRLAVVEIPEGTTFTSLRKLDGALEFLVTATVVSPISDIDQDETFEIGARTGGTSMRIVAGAVEAIRNGAGGSPRTIVLGKNGGLGLIGGGDGPTIRHTGLGSMVLLADASSLVEEDALGVVLNSFFIYSAIASSAQVNQPQSNANPGSIFFISSLFPRFTVSARVSAVPNLTENTLGLIDVSGGAVAQSLPEIALAGEHINTGMTIIMAESSGTAGLTVTPSGADTIDGGASATVAAGGSLVFVSDGVSNWKITASFDPNAAVLNAQQTFTGGAQTVAPAPALVFGANVAMNAALSNVFDLTLTGVTAQLDNPTGLTDGQTVIVRVTQDGVGGRALTFDTNWDFGTEGAPDLTTEGIGALSLITGVSDGTKVFVGSSLGHLA